MTLSINSIGFGTLKSGLLGDLAVRENSVAATKPHTGFDLSARDAIELVALCTTEQWSWKFSRLFFYLFRRVRLLSHKTHYDVKR